MDAAGDARVGVGFITWSMARQPRLLDLVLERRPAAVMLSFGEIGRTPTDHGGRCVAAVPGADARSSVVRSPAVRTC